MGNADSTERVSGVSQADIKRIATWGAGLLLTGAVGFAHGTLWAHESKIAVLENVQGAADRRADRIEAILHDILKELRK